MTTHGSFVLMLHSHLPWYRKAGMWPFGEENLYECMGETYLPLLNALYDLYEEGIKANITVGITPILAEQLADTHLQQGFITYLEKRLEMIAKDLATYPNSTLPHAEHVLFLARFYNDHFEKLLNDFTNRYQKNLLGAFKDLQDKGCIELTTSAATHGFLPLLANDEAIQNQVKNGVETYKRHFGRAPKGIWLPECAYRPGNEERPGIDAFLYENGLEYFFTEFTAIQGGLHAASRRDFGTYHHIQNIPSASAEHAGETGMTTDEAYWLKDYPVAVMGRNEKASFQVWSAAHGYPGDGLYREFHKQDSQSGMHYWRITSKESDFFDKWLYDPVQAFKKAEEHAGHYAWLIDQLMQERFSDTGTAALFMVSFDTELFGHWWFEGVHWLKCVIRNLNKNANIAVQTASDYLEKNPPRNVIDLPESTWGMGGHYWVWRNPATDWMWPIIHQSENRTRELINKHRAEKNPLKIRVLNQMVRELLLLESSDWPFLVTTVQAKDYAIQRFNEHVENFSDLANMLETDNTDTPRLEFLEALNNAFPTLDFRSFEYHPKFPKAESKASADLQPA